MKTTKELARNAAINDELWQRMLPKWRREHPGDIVVLLRGKAVAFVPADDSAALVRVLDPLADEPWAIRRIPK